MNWKPLMSKSEAEEYTMDSYYRGQDFYHGTSAENADGIMTIGAMWERDSENSYGDGFYVFEWIDRVEQRARLKKVVADRKALRTLSSSEI